MEKRLMTDRKGYFVYCASISPSPESVDLVMLVKGLAGFAAIVENGGEVAAHFHQLGDVSFGEVLDFSQRIDPWVEKK